MYQARQVALGRMVALKMILAGEQAGLPELARFRAEAETAACLQHGNIVQIYEVGAYRGRPYLALELVAGGNLAVRLQGQPLAPREAAQVVETLARAIHYAHQCGIVHRDLKPANVLLTPDGTPKIGDFGLAKRLVDNVRHTRSDAILGTPAYMAPEQAAGRWHEVGPAADIYSLGAILYELLTGRPPLESAAALETLRQLESQAPLAPRHWQPAVPRDLETICLKCLEKAPRQRYASAAALADDLRSFLLGEPIAARRIGPLERSWRWCRRKPAWALLAGVVSCTLLAIAVGSPMAVLWMRGQRDAALASERKAVRAERRRAEQLCESYRAQAEAGRLNGQAGRRVRGLKLLQRAAAIQPSVDLRKEAIGCLALDDLQSETEWSNQSAEMTFVTFDARLERYVLSDAQGNLSVRRVVDNQELMAAPGPGSRAWTVGFSRDGRFLASRNHPPHQERFDIRVWDLSAPGRLAAPRQLHGKVWDFHPDRGMLVVGADDGSLWLHDLDGQTEPKVLRPSDGVVPNCLCFDSTGRRVAISCGFNRRTGETQPDVRIMEIDAPARSWVLRRRKSVDEVAIRGLAWSDDGRRLAAACGDGRIALWSVAEPGDERSDQAEMVLDGHTAAAICVAFSHDGRLLASTGWDDALRVSDSQTGQQLVETFAGPCQPRFDAGDQRLGFAVDGANVAVCRIVRSREYHTYELRTRQGNGPCCVDVSPDGRSLAFASTDGVYLFDASTGRMLAELSAAPTAAVAFAPEGGALCAAGGAGLFRWPLERVGAGGNEELRAGPMETLRSGASGAEWTIDGFAPRCDGRRWAIIESNAAGNRRRAVLIRAEGTGEPLVLADETDPEYDRCLDWVKVSPDEKWVATGTWLGSGIKLWSVSTGRLVRSLHEPNAQLDFSPDGRCLVTGNAKRYWSQDLKTARPGPIDRPRERTGLPGPAAYSADGKMLAIAHELREVQLVDVQTNRELATLPTPRPTVVLALHFSSDGSRLIVICRGGVVQVWELGLLRHALRNLQLDWSSAPLSAGI